MLDDARKLKVVEALYQTGKPNILRTVSRAEEICCRHEQKVSAFRDQGKELATPAGVKMAQLCRLVGDELLRSEQDGTDFDPYTFVGVKPRSFEPA